MKTAPIFKPGDPVCDTLFRTPRALRNRDKRYAEGPIEVLPGHWSNDWDFLVFKDNLSKALTKEFPATVDDYGRVSGNGVRSNFYGLRHVNGFPMLPATYPIYDNRHLREEEGLVNDFVSSWHRNALTAIIELFFSDLEPAPMKVRKGSSSVIPFFTNVMSERLDYARQHIRHAETAGRLMLEGKYDLAWETYFFGGAYFVVYRRQSSDQIDLVDGEFISKDRPVADLEYAITGGTKGSYSPASKELTGVDFRVPAGFFRERNRTAYGGPWAMNSALMPIAHAVRKRIYRDYAYTYHHTTRESIQQDLREWGFTIAADVSNHDHFWPPFVLEHICNVLLEMGYAEWWVKLYEIKSKLPRYVTDVSPTEGNILIGDPRAPDAAGGLPSGHAFTDLEGTILMTWVYLVMMVEHTYPELIPQLEDMTRARECCDSFLRGKLKIRLKDKSDDALLGWAAPELLRRAEGLMEKMKKGESVSPYMKISYEHGGAFLGNILLYPTDKNPGGVVLIGNILSYVTNMFSPEYGVQSDLRGIKRERAKRPFPGLAWATMQQTYGTVPVYQEVREIVEREWFNVFHESYESYRRELLRSDEIALADYVRQIGLRLGIGDLTPIDREVLADPDKLQYRYTEDDVSPGVVDIAFNGITAEELEPYFRKIVP